VRTEVIEGNSVTLNGRFIPSVGPWAFQGARPGETSELFDAEDGYYLARLDSITPGGVQTLDQAKGDIRTFLMRRKKIDALLPRATNFAKVAAAGSLESAAQLMNQKILKPKAFSRVTGAPELTNLPEVVGAAFTLPLDSVSEPIKAAGGVVVMRVDERLPATRAAFDAQKEGLRRQALQQARQQRVREFLDNLRATADIEDNRRDVEASARRASQ
jgi:peptidyl-prolyl cis-trans isomerase D